MAALKKNPSIYYKKLSFVLLGFIIIFGLSSSDQSDGLTILNKGDNSFASIKIENPFGNDIIFSSGDSSGAFGFVLNGVKNWVKGQPKISRPSKDIANYEWKHDNYYFVMHTEKKNNDMEFTFKLKGTKQKPSAWMINSRVGQNEYFTGIFERVVDGPQGKSWEKGITAGLNLRGQIVDVKLKPTVSAYAPFYISSGNYAFFVHGTWRKKI